MVSATQMPLRIPSDLHRLLKKSAQSDGISLNQYCLYLLSRGVKSEKEMNQDKAERVLRFLEEAHILQKEMKPPTTPIEITPKETPLKRWKLVHGKN